MQASVPPPSWYTGADASVLEQERVFRKTWQVPIRLWYRAITSRTPSESALKQLVGKAAARHCLSALMGEVGERRRTWLGHSPGVINNHGC